MKKKAVLIILVIFICSAIGIIANNYQNKLISQSTVTSTNKDNTKINDSQTNEKQNSNNPSNETPVSNTAPESNVSKTTAAANGVTTNTTTNTKKIQTPPVQQPAASPNFIIYNDVSKQTLYSSNESFDGMKVADLTLKVLNRENIQKSYTTSLIGVYFSSIKGLAEKSAGEKSGWCFYVNGQKISVGSSSCTLKAGEVVTWKFLADAVDN